jgi:kynurenine formamidase
MKLIDLTLAVEESPFGGALPAPVIECEHWNLTAANGPYTAQVYNLKMNGMSSSYIDFPGHILETDSGLDASNCPLEILYRVRAAVIRLDRESGSGAVTAADLKMAAPAGVESGDAIIINALGERRFDMIESRSVWLAADAVQWIIGHNTKLLVSDIYESVDIQGVFRDLFAAGINTVCFPVNLDKLTSDFVSLTVLPLKVGGVTQIPCRIIAEVDE